MRRAPQAPSRGASTIGVLSFGSAPKEDATRRLRAAEVRGAWIHDLRRAAIVRFERAGVPRGPAKSITGHKTDSAYNRYNVVREAEQREGFARIAVVLPADLIR
jgi:integrase